MCLTDATALINLETRDAARTAAFNELKKKMLERKAFMERKIKDIDQALARIEPHTK